MDKKPIAKAKVLNKRKIGWILLAIGGGVQGGGWLGRHVLGSGCETKKNPLA
jgi:hypothetical protein